MSRVIWIIGAVVIMVAILAILIFASYGKLEWGSKKSKSIYLYNCVEMNKDRELDDIKRMCCINEIERTKCEENVAKIYQSVKTT